MSDTTDPHANYVFGSRDTAISQNSDAWPHDDKWIRDAFDIYSGENVRWSTGSTLAEYNHELGLPRSSALSLKSEDEVIKVSFPRDCFREDAMTFADFDSSNRFGENMRTLWGFVWGAISIALRNAPRCKHEIKVFVSCSQTAAPSDRLPYSLQQTIDGVRGHLLRSEGKESRCFQLDPTKEVVAYHMWIVATTGCISNALMTLLNQDGHQQQKRDDEQNAKAEDRSRSQQNDDECALQPKAKKRKRNSQPNVNTKAFYDWKRAICSYSGCSSTLDSASQGTKVVTDDKSPYNPAIAFDPSSGRDTVPGSVLDFVRRAETSCGNRNPSFERTDKSLAFDDPRKVLHVRQHEWSYDTVSGRFLLEFQNWWSDPVFFAALRARNATEATNKEKRAEGEPSTLAKIAREPQNPSDPPTDVVHKEIRIANAIIAMVGRGTALESARIAMCRYFARYTFRQHSGALSPPLRALAKAYRTPELSNVYVSLGEQGSAQQSLSPTSMFARLVNETLDGIRHTMNVPEACVFLIFLFNLVRGNAYDRRLQLHINLYVVGEQASGKSESLNKAIKLCVPDTVDVVTRSTRQSNAVHGDKLDYIRILHEADSTWLNREPDKKRQSTEDADFESYEKDVLESCRSLVERYESGKMVKYERQCPGINVRLSNSDTHLVPKPYARRWFWYHSERKRDTGKDLLMSTAVNPNHPFVRGAKMMQIMLGCVAQLVARNVINRPTIIVTPWLVKRVEDRLATYERSGTYMRVPQMEETQKCRALLIASEAVTQYALTMMYAKGSPYYSKAFEVEHLVPGLSCWLKDSEEIAAFALGIVSSETHSDLAKRVMKAFRQFVWGEKCSRPKITPYDATGGHGEYFAVEASLRDIAKQLYGIMKDGEESQPTHSRILGCLTEMQKSKFLDHPRKKPAKTTSDSMNAGGRFDPPSRDLKRPRCDQFLIVAESYTKTKTTYVNYSLLDRCDEPSESEIFKLAVEESLSHSYAAERVLVYGQLDSKDPRFFGTVRPKRTSESTYIDLPSIDGKVSRVDLAEHVDIAATRARFAEISWSQSSATHLIRVNPDLPSHVWGPEIRANAYRFPQETTVTEAQVKTIIKTIRISSREGIGTTLAET